MVARLRLSFSPSETGCGAVMSDTGLQKLAFLLLVILILFVSATGGV